MENLVKPITSNQQAEVVIGIDIQVDKKTARDLFYLLSEHNTMCDFNQRTMVDDKNQKVDVSPKEQDRLQRFKTLEYKILTSLIGEDDY